MLIFRHVFLAACVVFLQGCSSSELPYGLQLVSNSSYLWIVDKNGWGVLSEGINDESSAELSKLNQFFIADKGLYVAATQNNEIVYILVHPVVDDELSFYKEIFKEQEFHDHVKMEMDRNFNDIKWNDLKLSLLKKIGF